MTAILNRRDSYSRVNEVTKFVFGGDSGVVGTMTGTNVINSAPILASGASSSLSFQNVWTSNPTGTFSYQGSNDVDPIGNPIAGWSPVTPDVAAGNPAGALPAAGVAAAVFKNPPMRWYRQVYTNSVNSGVLTTIAEAKGT